MLEDIEVLYSYLKDSIDCFSYLSSPSNKINEIQKGMVAILFYLQKNISFETNVSDLANYLDVSKARIVKLIGKLENLRLIERNKSVKDSRVVLIKITPKGTEEVYTKYQAIINFFDYLRNTIGEQDMSTFYSIAKRIKIASTEYKLGE